jgi:hypothetical protein
MSYCHYMYEEPRKVAWQPGIRLVHAEIRTYFTEMYGPFNSAGGGQLKRFKCPTCGRAYGR